jgi:hypothetical protein
LFVFIRILFRILYVFRLVEFLVIWHGGRVVMYPTTVVVSPGGETSAASVLEAAAVWAPREEKCCSV